MIPDTKIVAGDTVPISYKVHHNGMAKLLWAKVHLMTEDGYDAGMGTINTASRLEWQVPADLKPGKYTFHLPTSSKCEGILSEMLPVEIVESTAVDEQKETDSGTVLEVQLRKRSLYTRRDLGVRLGGSDHLLEDGTTDTKKMHYMFSLI
ncbi:hypothetical protein BGX33_002175 [Mortierella sp. NVP41]|nr:hypothetical protein BGX33_002175 [Mortierella sp. NVP41]